MTAATSSAMVVMPVVTGRRLGYFSFSHTLARWVVTLVLAGLSLPRTLPPCRRVPGSLGTRASVAMARLFLLEIDPRPPASKGGAFLPRQSARRAQPLGHHGKPASM